GESFGAVNRYDFVDIKNDCTLVATFAEKIGGDVTEDGYCTEEDVSALRQALLNGESSARVDANYDDVSDIRDLVRINLASYDLYKGNFESGWSIGDSSGSFAFSNDKKSLSFDSGSATDSAYYNNAASFGDYLVSADFYYGDVDYTSKQSYIALVARRITSLKDYEFRVIVDKNTSPVITAELVKRNSSYTTLATFDSDYIQNVIGASEVSLEKTYNLKMLCVGSTVYCFINNCLLGSYTDLNEPFLSGGFGMKSYRAKGSVGNFSVLDKSGEK
ncbi:MAG: hypothetical protein MJ091_05980, partial [Clostridia bacterium]|nr:hypothetical protein [Clostridia bacterium]